MKASFTKKADVKASRLPWPLVWVVLIGVVLISASRAHLERYITPQRGLGYWLGIVGASMMVLLLMYSARKHVRWLRWLGDLASWFRFHMILGIVGPVLILFHANFSFGSTNSNVALISMLLVVGSGLVGRYIYARLHVQADGKEGSLEQWEAMGTRLRQKQSNELLPGLIENMELRERRFVQPTSGIARRLLRLLAAPFRIAMARYAIRREINEALLIARSRHSSRVEARARRMAMMIRYYAYGRLDASRRRAEFRMYERILSFWHVVHIPLFFMLLIAGVVHVIAINVY
jgi:hypothetical protein